MAKDEVSEFIIQSLRQGISRSEIRSKLLQRGLSESEVDSAMLSSTTDRDPSRELSVDIRPIVEEALQASEDLAKKPLAKRVIAARVELQPTPRTRPKVRHEDDASIERARAEHNHRWSKGTSGGFNSVRFQGALGALQGFALLAIAIYAFVTGIPTLQKWFDRLTDTNDSLTQASSVTSPSAQPEQRTQPLFLPAPSAVEIPKLVQPRHQILRHPASTPARVPQKTQRKLRSIPRNR